MEILRGDAEGAPHGAHHMAAGAASRVDDCALKLVFFVRAALTAHALLTLHPLTPRRSPLHRAAAPSPARQPLTTRRALARWSGHASPYHAPRPRQVVFTLRSRAQLTLLSMRALSMCMMMVMMMLMTVTKQQQARRYAQLYGRHYAHGFDRLDFYGNVASHRVLYGNSGVGVHPLLLLAQREEALRDEDFWHDFEAGRGGDGGGGIGAYQRLRLRLMQQVVLGRGRWTATTATDSHRQPQTATGSHRQPQTASLALPTASLSPSASSVQRQPPVSCLTGAAASRLGHDR